MDSDRGKLRNKIKLVSFQKIGFVTARKKIDSTKAFVVILLPVVGGRVRLLNAATRG